MTPTASHITETALASQDAFLAESLRTLPVCTARCQCPDGWHTVWAGLKGMGLMRGIYSQAAFLQEFLAPWRERGGHVMIAGAADTGLFDVLHALFPAQATTWTVVDRCPAPLDMVADHAAAAGARLEVRFDGLDTVRSQGRPWDLVFIHYTLSFMDPPARAAMLDHLRQDLAPGGTVVCAVRHKQADPQDGPARTAAWVEATAAQLRRTYASHPQLLEPLLAHLPAYAAARLERENRMPHFDTVRAEFAAAGFELLDSRRNPGQPYSSPDLPPPGSITTWVAAFAPAAAG